MKYRLLLASWVVFGLAISVQADEAPAGFTPLFNGKDLSGWHGWAIHEAKAGPYDFAKLPKAEQDAKIAAWTKDAAKHWKAENGELINDGHGAYLATDRKLTDYELLIEYKTVPKADSGIYLKDTPQVQIWDSTEEDKGGLGKKFGSGGLWNNTKGAPGKDPLVLADKPFGEWNKFRIIQIGARTTIYLNDKLVVENALLENFWNRNLPLQKSGSVLLQTHGGEIRWRNIFVKEFTPEEANQYLASKAGEGFKPLFDGKTLDGWKGAVNDYTVKDGAITCKPGKGGNLFTKDEYADFVVQVEYKVPEGGNNGFAIRYPGEGQPSEVAMCEIQVLDDNAAKHAKLDPRQYNGSVYGMAAAARGYERPIGQWNYQVITVKGPTIQIELNGNLIVNTDVSKIKEYMGGHKHPGKDRKSGYFGFAGHGDEVMFRNIKIKSLDSTK